MKSLITLLEGKSVTLVVSSIAKHTTGQGGAIQFSTIKEAVQHYLDNYADKSGFSPYIDTPFGSFKLEFVVPDRFKGMSRDDIKKQLANGVKPYSIKGIWEMWLKKPSVDPLKVKGTAFAEAVIAANS